MENNVAIRFEHVNKSYGNREILKDFNLEIRKGEFLTIIGSSGSGKTTVLKLINGLISPTFGIIYVDGKDIQISPNPVKDRLFIKGNFQSDIEQIHLYIYNVIGQQIASQSISVLGNTLEHSINMTGINVGIYYAVFDINGAKRITKKIIKQ